MASYNERAKRRTDEAIERASGATEDEAMAYAADAERRDREERDRRKRGKPVMAQSDDEGWMNAIRRMVGMRRE